MPTQISQLKEVVVHSTPLPFLAPVAKVNQLKEVVVWSRPGAVVPPVSAINQVKMIVVTNNPGRDKNLTSKFTTMTAITQGA